MKKNDLLWSLFLYYLYIFVWIQQGCINNTVFGFGFHQKYYKEVVVYTLKVLAYEYYHLRITFHGSLTLWLVNFSQFNNLIEFLIGGKYQI